MALWGVGVMVGPILGPTLGGYLTEMYNWRWVFYINLPIGILTILGLTAYLDETKLQNVMRFDWLGFATLSIAIGGLQMMLDRGQQLDWFSSAEIIVEAAIAGLAVYMFVVHTATTDNPFIDPKMFADRNFATGVIFVFFVGVILLATLALMTPYLQSLMGYPVLTAGLILAPRGIGTMIAMMAVGRVINRVDPRYMILTGLSLVAFSLYEMTGFTPDVAQFTLVWTGVVQGFGLGFIFVPLSTITFSTLSPIYRTQAASLFALMRNIGSSIGISIVIFLLGRSTQVMHAELATHANALNDLFRQPGVATLWNLNTEAGRLALNAEVSRQATIIAYANDFKLMMWVAIGSMPLVLLLRRNRGVSTGPSVAAID
jgi:DHA2 family multidrug resistance protein